MYYRKWKTNKTKAKEFAKKMNEIEQFCFENGITKSRTSNSYYFTINDQNYRVSNHTIKASNLKAYDDLGNKIREEYHEKEERKDTIYITASKTRIIEIYNNLKDGKKLDRRGNIK